MSLKKYNQYMTYLHCMNLNETTMIIFHQNAVDWLASHPCVRTGGIGMVGVSKGGQLAFLLGMATDKVSMVYQSVNH